VEQVVIIATIKFAQCLELLGAVDLDTKVDFLVVNVINLLVGLLVAIVHYFTGQVHRLFVGYFRQALYFLRVAVPTSAYTALTGSVLALVLRLMADHADVELELAKLIEH